MKKFFVSVLGVMMLAGANAASLSGNAFVNITSETASSAKNIAMNEARRQIITDVLSLYSSAEQLRSVISHTDNSDLMNLISATRIDGEKLSDTTYSARIYMTLNNSAVAAWLSANDVQNWLPLDVGTDNFIVVATLNNPIEDWTEINTIARSAQIDLNTDAIVGGIVNISVPVSSRSAFTAAIRNYGWKYANQDGVLKIWK